MSHRYPSIAKILISMLAVGIPLMLYQSYVNYRGLLRGDADLQKTLALEQDQLARRVASAFFGGESVMAYRVLQRRLPDGVIDGLPEPPPPETLRRRWDIELDEAVSMDRRTHELLWRSDRFSSGMPARYAGWVESCQRGDLAFTQKDFQRFYGVFAELWTGRDVDAATFAFLLGKLPEHLRHTFDRQASFLAVDFPDKRESNGFLVNVRTGEEHVMLDLPAAKLAEVNHLLRAVKSDIQFELSEEWYHWQDI